MEPSNIETERLRLDPQVVEDAGEMVAVLDDPALYRFTGGEAPSVTDLRARFERQATGRSPDGTEEWRNWIVRLRSEGSVIGTVQATIGDGGRTATIAWVIGTLWQGNGFAVEAAGALVPWLLHHGVRTVEANIHPDHAASAAVARRAGLIPTDRMHEGERVWRLPAGGPTGSIRFPVITARLLIRPTVDSDAEGLHATWGDPDVTRYLGPPLPTVEATRELLAGKMAQQERDGFSLWTVEERGTGAIVGTVGLQYEDGPEIGIGFLFAKRYWGRGYGREATAATLDAGFVQLGLPRIMGITEPANVSARRLMEAIGMASLGTARYHGRDWDYYEALRATAGLGEVPEE